jgi:DNA-binding CsgD family transcriptional regulator
MWRAIDPNLVIEWIYEAVTDPDAWNVALDGARRMLEADAALLVYGGLPVSDLRVIGSTGFSREVLDRYASHHLGDDEMVQRAMTGPVGIVVSTSRAFPGDSLFATSIHRRLLRPSGLSHVAGAAVLNSSEAHASLWLARSGRPGDFSQGDLEAFSGLVLHFSRAMKVFHRIRRAELRTQMAEGAFDRLAVGVVLLDVQGAPVMCNREAERIAARKDGFALDRFGPSADRPSDTKRMRDLIRSVGGDGPMGDREGAGTVRLLRPSGLPDYHVVILPLPRRCHSNCGRGTASVLFVTDPEKSQSLVDLLFCGLFDLTEAEVRLVSSLLEGGGLPAAAEKLGLSRNTVHSQLSSVFLKTNTRSQSELLTLLLTSVAPVEPPDEASGYNWPSSQQGRVRG